MEPTQRPHFVPIDSTHFGRVNAKILETVLRRFFGDDSGDGHAMTMSSCVQTLIGRVKILCMARTAGEQACGSSVRENQQNPRRDATGFADGTAATTIINWIAKNLDRCERGRDDAVFGCVRWAFNANHVRVKCRFKNFQLNPDPSLVVRSLLSSSSLSVLARN